MPTLSTPAVESAPGRQVGHVFETGINRIADVCNRYQYVVLSLFSLCYLLDTCYRAWRKSFWYDELFTVYLSRSFSVMWSALKQGVDFNPPVIYTFTHFSELAAGEGHIATRLPEIVSFWIFCLCLFRFVSVRTSPLAGFISMLFPLVTIDYYYAYEARPHGLVLGFAGVALICWQAAVDRPQRRVGWLLGLGGALVLAMLTHSFAILLLVPIGLGELARTARFRRIDWPVWLTMIAAAATILVSLPLLSAVKSNLGPSFYPATIDTLLDSYKSHMGAAKVLLGTLFLLCVAQLIPPRRQSESYNEHGLGEHEIVAIVGFMAIPFFAFLAAKIMGAPLLHRYSIACTAGFACLLGAAAAKRPAVGFGVLLLLIAQVGVDFRRFKGDSFLSEPSSSTAISTRMQQLRVKYSWMDAIEDKTLPIVLLDDFEFLPTLYYAPPHLSSRLVYLVWPNSGVSDEGYVRLRNCCKADLRFARLSDFLASHNKFLAYSRRGYYAARPNYFLHDGADVIIEKESANEVLWSVNYKLKTANAE